MNKPQPSTRSLFGYLALSMVVTSVGRSLAYMSQPPWSLGCLLFGTFALFSAAMAISSIYKLCTTRN